VVTAVSLAEAGARHFDEVIPGERYRLRVPGLMLDLEADHLRWERGELMGKLAVYLDLEGVASVSGLTESSTMNFSSLSVRSSRAALLAKLTRTPEYPWGDLLQLFSLHVMKAIGDGDPAIDLRDVESDASANTSETVLGLPVLRYDAMMICAKGGEGKSLLLLKLLGDLQRRGYSVGFVDSEWNEFVHRDRLGRLYGDDLPSVWYLRLNRSLVTEVDRVRKFRYERGLDFIGFDSVGMGTDAGMEYSDAPNQYLRAVRSLGRVGSILISHTKHEAENGSHKRPYGSPYWLNGCRAVWFLKSALTSEDRYEVVLEQIKVNVAKARPVALRFDFTGGRTTIEPMATSDLTELAGAISIRERIITALKRRGAMTLDELTDDLGEKRESIKKAVNREVMKLFTKVTSSDGKVTKYGLLERRSA